MKIRKLIVVAVIFIIPKVNAQNFDKIHLSYASHIKSFSLDGATIQKNSFYGGNETEITIKNKANNILRFKVDKNNKLISYHAGIVYELYEYKDNYLQKHSFYNKDGNISGEEFAIAEFFIEKPVKLIKKFAIINEREGNMDTNDANEKIVLQKLFNAQGKLLQEEYIATSEYWQMQNLIYRP